MMSSGYHALTFIFVTQLISFSIVFAQISPSYTPRNTSSENSTSLIQKVEERYKMELRRSTSSYVKEMHRGTRLNLINMIKQHQIIEDESLQNLVDVVRARLILNTTIKHVPGDVFILKNPSKNAISYSEGNVCVTIGLLGVIENEAQLAFTIAHEIAHYELDHSRKRIEAKRAAMKTIEFKKSISDIQDEKGAVESLTAIRDLINSVSSLTRENEVQADSFAMVMIRNARYNQREAISMLHLLPDEMEADSTMNIRFLLQLDFKSYPLQERWFDSREDFYHKKPSGTFLFDYDSLQTHPEMNRRLKQLEPLLNSASGKDIFVDFAFFNTCVTTAKYESVQSAFDRQAYDRCIHLALKLLQRNPNDNYLVSIITTCLYTLSNANPKDYLKQYTWGYSEELKLVNNFLYNISGPISLNIAYFFLTSNFSEETEEHYWLLWKIFMEKDAVDDANDVKQRYSSKFPDGKFKESMIKNK